MVLRQDPPATASGLDPAQETAQEMLRRIAVAGPLRHGRPVGPQQAGSHYEVVAGVPCAALPLPWSWAAQACLSAVPDEDLVDVAGEVTGWLTRFAAAGWQLEIDSARAPAVAEALGLAPVREFDVWVSTGDLPPLALASDVDQPVDDDEFLAVFGPELAPMISGQLGRPDWDVGVLRESGAAVGCYRLMDLADATYLGGVTVVPRLRGRGLGRALSAYVTDRARRRSDLVWLQCEPALGPFYAGIGYTVLGRSTFLGP
jgi:GNAT superfamily N-acetyltransferase